MTVRVVFSAILLGSTFRVHYQSDALTNPAYIVLYYLVAFIFFVSLVYAFVAKHIKQQVLFTYLQFSVDSFIVTLIIYITGGFFSFFSFLYLVIIIYASMILYFKGGIYVAGLNTIFYTTLIVLEFTTDVIHPPFEDAVTISNLQQNWSAIILRIVITSAACFAVAVLSGLLTEQNRKSQIELQAMEVNLKRVEKMAYMGEMAAGLAHEIKNPLASLVGSIQMLKEDLRYDADHERLMEIILRETDRLSTLVSDFLFFARPPVGKPETVNLNDAISEVTDLFEKDPTHSKKFKLRKNLWPDVWVLIDPTHFSQVLWNLLLNAAEAIKDDGEIEIRSHVLKNALVQVQVHDNGCGMSPDVVQAIFDPFFTTKPEGTGLGLSIVHRILASCNSRLDVQTTPGLGTIFSFTLNSAMRQGHL